MLEFLIRRTTLALLTLIILSVIGFAIIQMPPGDYVDLYIIEFMWWNPGATTEQLNAMEQSLRAQYHLDDPLYVQYASWAGKMIRGQFGESLEHNLPISQVLGDRMLLTVILAMSTVVFTWTMAIPIGIYSAVRQRSAEDYAFTFLGFIGLAVPDFMLALLRWVAF